MKKVNKKILDIILTVIGFIICIIVFVGCSKKNDSYTVTFDTNGGVFESGTKIQIVNDPKDINPPVFTKKGYTFVGWDIPLSNITETKTVKAQWEPIIYNIVYDLNGGTDLHNNPIKYTVEDEDVEIKSIYREGYTFLGWSLNQSDDLYKTYSISGRTGDLHLKAVWEANEYKVIYNPNTGEGKMDTQIFVYDEEEQLSSNEFVKDGYTFLGWSTKKDSNEVEYLNQEKVLNLSSEGEVNLYAVWGSSEYKVSYYCDGELVFQNTAIYGEKYKLIDQPFYEIKIIKWQIEEQEFDVNSSIDYVYTKDISVVALYAFKNNNYDVELTDEGITITKYYGSDRELIVPHYIKYDGDYYKVTKIGDNLFKNNKELKKIVLPSTLTKIGDYAFYYSSLENIEMSKNVTDIGESAFCCCSMLMKIELPSRLVNIGGSAFSGCSSLTSITIPEGVVNIGNYAFSSCDKLKNIEISESVVNIGNYAFYGCSNLESIKILEGVVNIGNYAFSSCDKLKNIEVPKSVTQIGLGAFQSCYSLELITLPFVGEKIDSEKNSHFGYIFGADDYSKSYWIPKSLKKVVITGMIFQINEYAFYDCDYLTCIEIPNTVTKIGDFSFYECSSLKSMVIPEGVESIGNNAFYGCNKLKNIKIPESITSIGDCAFYDCWGIISVSLPNTLQNIGNKAFYGCYRLVEIYDFTNNLTIKEGETNNGYVGYYAEKVHDVLEDSILRQDESGYVYFCRKDIYSSSPGYIKTDYFLIDYVGDNNDLILPDVMNCQIYQYAFCGCDNITSIVIPNSVTSIGNNAFYGCNSLESISLPFVGISRNSTSNTHFGYIFGSNSYKENEKYVPKSLKKVVVLSTQIEDYAFYGCEWLENIELSSKLLNVGDSAFVGCDNLKNVYFDGTMEEWSEIEFSASTANPMCYADDFYVKDINGQWTLLTELVLLESVTKINKFAFYGFGDIKNIIIPNSVENIGKFAFYGCNNLKSITLPFVGLSKGKSSYSFFGYIFGSNSYDENSKYIPKTLKEVIMEGSRIDDYAFYGCEWLEKIELSKNLLTVGNSSFVGCNNLKSVYYSGTMQEWNNIEFYFYTSNPIYYAQNFYTKDVNNEWKILSELVLPEGITNISNYAFSGYKKLTSVVMPKTLQNIGHYAFINCSNLNNMEIPQSVTNIGIGAFYGCSNLESVLIPEGITDINGKTFYGCDNLRSVKLPSTLTKIEYGAFFDCSNLIEIQIPKGVNIIENHAFYNCTSLLSVVIPIGVTEVHNNAFSNCNNLTIYCEEKSKPSCWNENWCDETTKVIWGYDE